MYECKYFVINCCQNVINILENYDLDEDLDFYPYALTVMPIGIKTLVEYQLEEINSDQVRIIMKVSYTVLAF